MLSIVSSDVAGRRGHHLLAVTLLLIGSVLIVAASGARHGHASKEHKRGHSSSAKRVNFLDKTVCQLDPKVNSNLCDAYFPSWSYDKSSGKCVSWVFGGCGGNANRFKTQPECEKTCLRSDDETTSTSTTTRGPNSGGSSDEEKCNAPMLANATDTISWCLLPPRKWSFDKSSGKCLLLPSCQRTKNDFKSQSECEQTCLSSSSSSSRTTTSRKPRPDAEDDDDDICDDPRVQGNCPCGGARWTFDELSGKCDQISYCSRQESSRNIFGSLEACVQTCERQSSSSETTLRNKPSPDEAERRHSEFGRLRCG